ncbi:hypothetical protein PG999_012353 [Apiospora kogelbergensis]|uniref:Uncharacterized protein n=1 Tax=Apiospora kogelbergensis TaxID=1337665 RepID=A0AAW0QI72_9PEZI
MIHVQDGLDKPAEDDAGYPQLGRRRVPGASLLPQTVFRTRFGGSLVLYCGRCVVFVVGGALEVQGPPQPEAPAVPDLIDGDPGMQHEHVLPAHILQDGVQHAGRELRFVVVAPLGQGPERMWSTMLGRSPATFKVFCH